MSEAPPATTFELRVERAATGGGVGRAPDGRVTFVRNSLPGELVRVEISETTARFARGDAVEILEASPERVAAPCPYATPGGCGGCDLQHASQTAQLQWKAALVREHLARIAGVERSVEVVAAPGPRSRSRTRLRCGVDAQGRLGLRRSRSHDLISIEECWLSDARFAPAFQRAWPGVSEVELRAIGDGAPFVVARRQVGRQAAYDLRSLEGSPLDPATHSRVDVKGHVYRVSPLSFWQSHRDAPATLLDTVVELADVSPGDDVVDLFSGVGLFSVPLAKLVGASGRVSAVESSPHAVRDARDNGAGLGQLKVREWSVTPRSINDTVREGSIVVLDPPRHGLGKGVAAALARRGPRRIVYVSCDAATFSRDLKEFLGHGFALSDLRVFDLFPMTEHVEVVSLLDSPGQMGESADEGRKSRAR